jgi:hypothetical protein
MAALCVGLILAYPDTESREQAEPLQASPSVTARGAGGIGELRAAFPADLLGFRTLTLVEGTCADAAWEGGTARIAVLRWQDADGTQLTTTTICPSRAISLLDAEGWRLSDRQGLGFFDARGAAMDRGGRRRVHVQMADALYAVEYPADAADSRTAAWLADLGVYTESFIPH